MTLTIRTLSGALLAAAFATLPNTASATEVSLELGSIAAKDAAWDAFSSLDKVGTIGGRVGIPYNDRITILAGWQHGVHGGTVQLESWDDDNWEDEGLEFGLALTSDQLTLGAKLEHALTPWVVPYVTGQALGYRAVLRMDDDLESNDNPNQVRDVAFAPGVVGSAGIQLVGANYETPVQFTTHLEGGYATTLGSLSFDGQLADSESEATPVHVGELAFRGLYLRLGMGVRF